MNNVIYVVYRTRIVAEQGTCTTCIEGAYTCQKQALNRCEELKQEELDNGFVEVEGCPEYARFTNDWYEEDTILIDYQEEELK